MLLSHEVKPSGPWALLITSWLLSSLSSQVQSQKGGVSGGALATTNGPGR